MPRVNWCYSFGSSVNNAFSPFFWLLRALTRFFSFSFLAVVGNRTTSALQSTLERADKIDVTRLSKFVLSF